LGILLSIIYITNIFVIYQTLQKYRRNHLCGILLFKILNSGRPLLIVVFKGFLLGSENMFSYCVLQLALVSESESLQDGKMLIDGPLVIHVALGCKDTDSVVMVIYHPEHVLQHKVIGMASQGIVKFPVQLNVIIPLLFALLFMKCCGEGGVHMINPFIDNVAAG